jgi:hypothetical protein
MDMACETLSFPTRWFAWTVMLVVAALALPPALHAETKPRDKVFVEPVQGSGLEPTVFEALFGLVVVTLSRADVADTVTIEDVREQVEQEKRKEVLGCNNVSCATELAGALGVRYLLTTRVKKLGGGLIVTTSLIDTVEQHSRNGQGECTNREEEYRKAVEAAVAEALGLVKRSLTVPSQSASLVPESAGAAAPSPSAQTYRRTVTTTVTRKGQRLRQTISDVPAGQDAEPSYAGPSTGGIRVVSGDESSYHVKILSQADNQSRACSEEVNSNRPCFVRGIPAGPTSFEFSDGERQEKKDLVMRGGDMSRNLTIYKQSGYVEATVGGTFALGGGIGLALWLHGGNSFSDLVSFSGSSLLGLLALDCLAVGTGFTLYGLIRGPQYVVNDSEEQAQAERITSSPVRLANLGIMRTHDGWQAAANLSF